MVNPFITKLGLSCGLALLWGGGGAIALPGQQVSEVQQWIRAHPLLRPEPGETLRVQKNETAARWFTFEASVLPPGRAEISDSGQVIRSEELAFFDVVAGVSRDRLVEILQAIYGEEVYQDFERSRLFFLYPAESEREELPSEVSLEDSEPTPTSVTTTREPTNVDLDSSGILLEPDQPEPVELLLPVAGEVRVGSRYAYWIELTRNPDGVAYNGRLTIFQVEDLDHLMRTLMVEVPEPPDLDSRPGRLDY
jgi:hypothetical protein